MPIYNIYNICSIRNICDIRNIYIIYDIRNIYNICNIRNIYNICNICNICKILLESSPILPSWGKKALHRAYLSLLIAIFMHILLDKGYFILAYSHYPKPPCADVWNMDETGYTMGFTYSAKVVVLRGSIINFKTINGSRE